MGVPGVALYDGAATTLETLRHMVGGEVQVALGWTRGAQLRLLPWFSWSRSDLRVEAAGLALGGSSSWAESAMRGTRLHLSVPVDLDDAGLWRLFPSATLAYRHETYEGRGVVDSPTGAERHRVAAVAAVRPAWLGAPKPRPAREAGGGAAAAAAEPRPPICSRRDGGVAGRFSCVANLTGCVARARDRP